MLEHYPRDELFQIDEDTLYSFALAILQLDERPRVRVLARRDRFDRFVSVLVFVPRERYDSHIRVKIGAYLARAFIGRVSAFYPYLSGEGPLVRVHFIIGRSGGATPAIDRATLEREVEAIIRTWSDGLNEALALANSTGQGARAVRRATATRSPTASRKPMRRRLPPATSASSRGCPNSARSASTFITAWRKTSGASA